MVYFGDGWGGGFFWGNAGGDAVDGPLTEDELHDGLAPAGERDGGGEVVCIAAAADQGGVADAAGSFGERAAGAGGGGDVAVDVEGYCANGVVRLQRLGGFFIERGGLIRGGTGEGLVGCAG